MGKKKKSWFNLLKGILFLESNSKTEKKEKRRKWMFGRLKVKRLPPSIAAPLSPPREMELQETERHTLTVALATAAAAEAAAVAAAAQAAAEVFCLANDQSSRNEEKETEEAYEVLDIQQSKTIQENATIKIQTAFRAYLARKALRALKGIVKLQAIIRGRAVRRQAMTTLKRLQSMVNIQSQVCARRSQVAEVVSHFDENKQFLQTMKDKIIKIDTNSQRRWDDSILTKEEAEAMLMSRKEAAMKRERIKEYACIHRKSAESELNKADGRWKYWLDKWVDTQVPKSKELEDLDSIWTPNPNPNPAIEDRAKHLKLRTNSSQNRAEDHQHSPVLIRRRSFHNRKHTSIEEDSSIPTSPRVPTYMAATQSAKAKARSASTPRLRPGSYYDTQSESYSPYKNRFALIPSVTSEVAASQRLGRASAYQQRSPRLKGLQGPVKSLKDLSLNSDCSLPIWDRQCTFR